MKKAYRKIWMLSKLGASILKAHFLKLRMPVFMGLYITNCCNLRCSYCCINVDNRFDDPNRQGFTKDEISKIVDELYDMGTRWIYLLGGEPLMHKDIGSIVRHIIKKGILLHVLTNGTMVEGKIDEIEPADAICISIDGGEKSTDKMRGKGTFRRALRGVEVALSRGMRVRLHAVLNKYSLGEAEMLAEMAKDLKVTITISPLNYLGTATDSAEQLTKEEYRDFYIRYRKLKENGFPIGNSYFSIDKVLCWPIGYHDFITTEQHFPNYDPVPCVIGYLHGCIDAEGTMFNCIQMGCLNGPNIKEIGVHRAWNELLKNRPSNCASCASINTIETAAYLNLKPQVMIDGFRFYWGMGGRKEKKAKL